MYQHRSLSIALHVVVAFFAVTFTNSAAAQLREGRDSDVESFGDGSEGEVRTGFAELEQRIVERTNEFRKEKGREPVQTNPKLKETAAYFAQYMARTDKYGHHADGQRPSQRADNHGYDYCLVSENIAYAYSSAGLSPDELVDKFVTGWIESKGHRENMLEPAVTETGVAVAQSKSSNNYYAVQMFGRPESMKIEFQVSNRSKTTVSYELGDRSFELPPRYTRTHQRCEPTEMKMELPSEESSEKPATKTLQPAGGEHYVVSSDPSGGLEVGKQED